jgi:hypothetical protein
LRAWLGRLALLVSASCIGLLAAEGLVRVFFPDSREHVVPGGLFVIDGDLGWRLRPGASATHRSRYFRVVYSINPMGYRDPPRNVAKDPARRRILLHGDSQVFGWGLEEGQRFSALIERRSPSLEVWNQAVPGYGLDQQVLAYELHGQLPAVDEVLLFVSEATLSRIHFDRIYQKRKPRFTLDRSGVLQLESGSSGSPVWSALLYRVLSPLHLPYFVERRLAILRSARAGPAGARHGTARGTRELDPLARALIERAGGVARQRGHELAVLAVLPDPAAAALGRLCAETGIGFLAIELPREGSRALVFGEHDAHWNAGTHEWIAEQLAPRLSARAAAGGRAAR